jgi:hypothetical protein
MSEIAIDLSVLLFALGVSVATGVLFGLAPSRKDGLMTSWLLSRRAGTEGPAALDAIASAARSLWPKLRGR